MVDSKDCIDINLRSSGYLIAQTIAVCRQCSQPTHLYAVGLPSGHEVLELDDEALGAGDTWQVSAHAALLFHVAFLSANVQRHLHTISRTYRIAVAAPHGEACWTNSCEHCGVQFDDQILFSEPGDAFVPASDADARRIHLCLIDESIEACAAGYAHQPEFFDSMSRA